MALNINHPIRIKTGMAAWAYQDDFTLIFCLSYKWSMKTILVPTFRTNMKFLCYCYLLWFLIHNISFPLRFYCYHPAINREHSQFVVDNICGFASLNPPYMPACASHVAGNGVVGTMQGGLESSAIFARGRPEAESTYTPVPCLTYNKLGIFHSTKLDISFLTNHAFHLIEHPIDGYWSGDGFFPSSSASIASLRSCDVTFSGCCQLSSICPW